MSRTYVCAVVTRCGKKFYGHFGGVDGLSYFAVWTLVSCFPLVFMRPHVERTIQRKKDKMNSAMTSADPALVCSNNSCYLIQASNAYDACILERCTAENIENC